MYRYRLFYEDGSDAGEATYAVLIRPGEEILTGDGRRLWVKTLVPNEDKSTPVVGLLMVQSAPVDLDEARAASG